MDFTNETGRLIDELYHNRKHVELTIGVRKSGETAIIHRGPERTLNDTELIYAAGSICKPFTASYAAKYIAEGKLDLDAPISACIPDLPRAGIPPCACSQRIPPAIPPSPTPRSRPFPCT